MYWEIPLEKSYCYLRRDLNKAFTKLVEDKVNPVMIDLLIHKIV